MPGTSVGVMVALRLAIEVLKAAGHLSEAELLHRLRNDLYQYRHQARRFFNLVFGEDGKPSSQAMQDAGTGSSSLVSNTSARPRRRPRSGSIDGVAVPAKRAKTSTKVESVARAGAAGSSISVRGTPGSSISAGTQPVPSASEFTGKPGSRCRDCGKPRGCRADDIIGEESGIW